MLKDSSPKLLIVDDESAHQLALMDILESSDKNYDLLSAFNEQEALAIAKKELPDLILTDWEMPVMNGVDFILAIKNDKLLCDIPVIMCTGIMTSSEHLKTALEAGANDYVRKPFDAIEVDARINAMLSFSREQKKRRRAEQELMQHQLDKSIQMVETKQHSLVVTKACLMHNTAYIEDIVARLKALAAEVSESCKMKLFLLISKIQSDLKRGTWEEFTRHFEEIHPSFLRHINYSYPKLSANEVELCLYIKMNMSNAEIQTATYKSYDALKKARQRLKKKLDLSPKDSLDLFIQAID